MGYFHYNKINKNNFGFRRLLLYQEFPEHFIWDKKEGKTYRPPKKKYRAPKNKVTFSPPPKKKLYTTLIKFTDSQNKIYRRANKKL